LEIDEQSEKDFKLRADIWKIVCKVEEMKELLLDNFEKI
jgi:hypothetical protein